MTNNPIEKDLTAAEGKFEIELLNKVTNAGYPRAEVYPNNTLGQILVEYAVDLGVDPDDSTGWPETAAAAGRASDCRGRKACRTTQLPPRMTAASKSRIRIRPRAKEGFLFGFTDIGCTSFLYGCAGLLYCKIPYSALTVRMRSTLSSMRDCVSVPSATAALTASNAACRSDGMRIMSHPAASACTAASPAE